MTTAESMGGIVLTQLLTVDELAALLKVSKRTVFRMRSAHHLPNPIKVGGGVRWRAEEVQNWIEKGCPACPAQKLRH